MLPIIFWLRYSSHNYFLSVTMCVYSTHCVNGAECAAEPPHLLQQWSFGVTCWEVFTCGGVPYAGVPTTALCSELKSGHRLDRPSNLACSDDMYVVRDCLCVVYVYEIHVLLFPCVCVHMCPYFGW